MSVLTTYIGEGTPMSVLTTYIGEGTPMSVLTTYIGEGTPMSVPYNVHWRTAPAMCFETTNL